MTARTMRACTRAFGQSVTYRPAVGSPYALTHAIWDETYQAVDPDTGAVVQSLQPRLGVLLSELSAAPAEGDHVDVDGYRYRVVGNEVDGGGGTTLALHKVGAVP